MGEINMVSPGNDWFKAWRKQIKQVARQADSVFSGDYQTWLS